MPYSQVGSTVGGGANVVTGVLTATMENFGNLIGTYLEVPELKVLVPPGAILSVEYTLYGSAEAADDLIFRFVRTGGSTTFYTGLGYNNQPLWPPDTQFSWAMGGLSSIRNYYLPMTVFGDPILEGELAFQFRKQSAGDGLNPAVIHSGSHYKATKLN